MSSTTNPYASATTKATPKAITTTKVTIKGIALTTIEKDITIRQVSVYAKDKMLWNV
jgi:hypothetical protein